LVILFAVASISGTVVYASNASAIQNIHKPASITVSFTKPVLKVRLGKDSQTIFDCQDVQWLSLSGEPQIPWKVMTVLLPSEANMSSLSCSIKKSQYESVKGQWQVPPKPAMSTLQNKNPIKIWPKNKTIINGKDADIYSQNDFWPKQQPTILHTGKLGEYQLAQIAMPLVRYHPINNVIKKLVQAEVILSFDNKVNAKSKSNKKTSSLFKKRVYELAGNSEASIDSYDELLEERTILMDTQSIPDPNTGYAIITTTQIQSNSTKLSDFVSHKESLGFDVQIVTESDFGGGTGDTAAENIRTWLQNNYVNDSIEYVLLIGNPNTTDGDIPMKNLWPRHDAGDGLEDSPSDYYYADMTGNWDLDGDGFFGEWEEDFDVGGVDRFFEIIVGRIPNYGSIPDLDSILERLINYESEFGEDEQWRKNVLIPSNPLSGSWPGFRIGEQIKYSILEKEGWASHRIYDDNYFLIPPPETVPCTMDNVINVWNGSAANSNGKFGLVVWSSHGSEFGSSDIINMPSIPLLDDNYPSFTFQASCSNSKPDVSNNFSYELLKHGGICTLGATTLSYYLIGAGYNKQEEDNMAYEYTEGLVSKGFDCGRALNDLREVYYPVSSEGWLNHLTFNIYGDPALRIIRQDLTEEHTPATYHVDTLSECIDPNGLSWATAFNDLQEALSIALAGDEIQVAEGVYTPAVPGSDRGIAFRPTYGVSVCGGFPSGGGAWDERDPNLYETILSGDLNGNDSGDWDDPSKNENSHHVLIGTCDFTLDGFTITGGNSNISYPGKNQGGGMVLSHCSATIRNCVLTKNYALHGGAAYNCYYGWPTFINCVFTENSSGDSGGAIYILQSNIKLIDSTFVSNVAQDYDGAAIKIMYGAIDMSDCTFTNNRSTIRGGAMHLFCCDLSMNDCIISGNSAREGAGIFACQSSTLTMENCVLSDNWTLSRGDSGEGSGGGIYSEYSELDLRNCIISNNSSTTRGGGAFVHYCDTVSIDNCIFNDNHADEQGGALYLSRRGATINNCTIVNNSADISNNGYGDGLYAVEFVEEIHISNSIFWNNLHDQITKAYPGYTGLIVKNSCIQDGYSGTDIISSDPLFAFTNPFDPNNNDYHLKSQAGRWDPNSSSWVTDTLTSPCIDTGDAASAWTSELWPHGKRINMGAYGGTAEASMSLSTAGNKADFNKDGFVNVGDLALFADKWPTEELLLAEDINRNGVVNLADWAEFAAQWLWQE
jgi:predicted outer membrane repeat protein